MAAGYIGHVHFIGALSQDPAKPEPDTLEELSKAMLGALESFKEVADAFDPAPLGDQSVREYVREQTQRFVWGKEDLLGTMAGLRWTTRQECQDHRVACDLLFIVGHGMVDAAEGGPARYFLCVGNDEVEVGACFLPLRRAHRAMVFVNSCHLGSAMRATTLSKGKAPPPAKPDECQVEQRPPDLSLECLLAEEPPMERPREEPQEERPKETANPEQTQRKHMVEETDPSVRDKPCVYAVSVTGQVGPQQLPRALRKVVSELKNPFTVADLGESLRANLPSVCARPLIEITGHQPPFPDFRLPQVSPLEYHAQRPCAAAQGEFVCDVTYPDGESVRCGQELLKTWRVRNRRLKLVPSEPWHAQTKAICRTPNVTYVSHSVGRPVGPDEVVDVTVVLTAPPHPGKFETDWFLCDPERGVVAGSAPNLELFVVP
eukprot:TRINITY_DN21005_c0_g1_i2.p1 TRINITY_DN21005_c0_g1~~TRINITY_DN21005_c0_g1_i2.p1  ORF type:complete len:432 (+),score=61.59 TRINITY_DN21005_c0_g1_i2:373-1668(+)